MRTYKSQTLIHRLSELTDSYLHKAISQWQLVPGEQFSNKAAPEKWSATECLMHLNSYGSYYLPEIEKAISKSLAAKQEPAAIFQSGRLGNYFTGLMLPKENGMPGKKMSAPRDHTPRSNGHSYEVIAAFIDQQETLLSLLEQAKQVDLNRVKVPISIAKFIRLKLGDVLLFLVAHQYRHLLQIDRALEQAGTGPQYTETFSLSGFCTEVPH